MGLVRFSRDCLMSRAARKENRELLEQQQQQQQQAAFYRQPFQPKSTPFHFLPCYRTRQPIMKVKGKGKSLRAELSAYRLQACAANCLQSLRASMKFPNKRMKLMKALLRMWRLLVIRGPPSDSDGERPRPINGQLVSPQHLWEVGCRIYMTAVPDVFRAWRAKAEWRADWRGVPTLAGWENFAETPRPERRISPRVGH